MAAERQMFSQQYEGDFLRNHHEKDLILKKYEAQAQ